MALDQDLVHQIRTKHGEEKIILSLEEKGFCVALHKDGTTAEKEARDVRDFLPMISESSVSWVDYIVEDLRGDAQKLASVLGFSDQLLGTLVKCERSGYEDLDNEMGLMIPAIIVNGFNVAISYRIILRRPGLVVTIHTTAVKRFFRLRRYAKIFMRKIKPASSSKDKLTMVLLRIIDENNARNFDHLREIEENSDKVSEKLSSIK